MKLGREKLVTKLAGVGVLALLAVGWGLLSNRGELQGISPDVLARLQALGYAHDVEGDPVEGVAVGHEHIAAIT